MYRALSRCPSLRSSSRLTPRRGSLTRHRLLLVHVAAATPRHDIGEFLCHDNLRCRVQDQLVSDLFLLYDWLPMPAVGDNLRLLTRFAFH